MDKIDIALNVNDELTDLYGRLSLMHSLTKAIMRSYDEHCNEYALYHSVAYEVGLAFDAVDYASSLIDEYVDQNL